MLSLLSEMLSYTFMLRAVVVGLLVSVCASLLGVSLVLRRYSMIGDGLSHIGFGALAVASAVNIAPLWLAVPVVVVAAFLLLRISDSSVIKGDAAIAVISTGSLAIGVIVISVSTGANTDLNSYMFGSILSMTEADVVMSIILCATVLVVFVLLYNRVFVVTFDESFSRAVGIKADVYNALIAVLTAVTIVLGMRMMGALLISALIIFPVLTAMRLCRRFKTVVLCSACVSAACLLTGVSVSYLYSLPTGASVVAVNLAALIIFSAARRIAGRSVKEG